MALRRDWIPSPNYSSRGGTPVRLAVIHTAEGALTYQSLGSFFANPASGVSSQTGIDDTPGVIGEYVTRTAKPWTQGNANPYSTATELCAFAAWTRTDWLRHDIMLDNCRRWIEEECAHFGIPRVKLTAAQAQAGVAGVCGHVDLGSAGGGHWDPGPEFPWDVVLGDAGSPPQQEDDLTPEQAQQLARIDALVSENHTRIIQLGQKQNDMIPQVNRLDGLVSDNHTRIIALTEAVNRLEDEAGTSRDNLTDPPGPPRSPRRRLGPDLVALVLALGLGLLANLILIGTIVQILHGNPEVTLSENATQILIASSSGITGVLGGYMGYRLRRDNKPPDPD